MAASYILLLGPWAQIIRNMQAGNAGGLSRRSVFLIAAGLSCTVLYNFFMNLPLAYRVMHPLILSSWLVLAWQEYHYSATRQIRRHIRIAYSCLAVLFIIIFAWGQTDQLYVGTLVGWGAALFLGVFQIPQVLKNESRSSVSGLSFTYLTILCAGSSVELAIAYWRLLPLQSVLNAVRGISFYLIFVYQFARYYKKPTQQKS